MKRKLTFNFHRFLAVLGFSFLFVLATNGGHAQIFGVTSFSDMSTPYTGTGITVDGNLNATTTTITAVGVSSNAGAGRYNFKGFSTATTNSTPVGTYFSFTITPKSGAKFSLTTFTFVDQASGTGPGKTLTAGTGVEVRSSIDGFATTLGSPANPNNTNKTNTIDVSGASFQNLTSAIEFRVYGYGGSSAAGTFSINSFSFTGSTSAGPTVTISDNSQITTQTMTAGTNGNVISKAKVVIANAAATISSISFSATAASTYLAADLTGFRLYRSTSSTYDGNAGSPSGVFIGVGDVASTKTSGTAEIITFSTAQSSLAANTYYYYLVADVKAVAVNNHNINIAGLIASNISSSGSTVSGSTTAAGPSSIGNKPVVTGNSGLSGTVGTAFSFQVSATQSPSSYGISSGSLPTSLNLNTTTGLISGTPTVAGSYTAFITATNTPGGVSTPSEFDFVISSGSLQSQTINFTPFTTPVTYGDAQFNLTATASSGLQVNFSSDNTSVATVSGNTVSIIGAGTANIIANQPGDGTTYGPATPVSLLLTVNKKSLSITNPAVATKVYDGTTAATITGTFTVAGGLANAGDASGLTLAGNGTFASANANSGIAVTANCSITGSKSSNYSLVQPTGLIGTISKLDQTITFGALPPKAVGDGTFSAGATVSTGGLAISYNSSNTNVATINASGIITVLAVGTTTITASQAGDANHNAATSVQQPLTVTPTPIALATWSNTNSTLSTTMTLSQAAANINTASTVTQPVANLTASTSGARFSFTKWDASSTSANYISVTVTPASGFVLNLAGRNFTISLGSSNTGPGSYLLYSSVNNYASSIATLTSGCGSSVESGDISYALPATASYNGLSSITFKIVGSSTGCSGNTAAGGTGGPDHIIVNGSVTCTAPGTPTTATPASVCQGSSVVITGTGGSAASYTFWTAATGGSQITSATNPPGSVSGNTLTTPTSLTGGSYTYYIQGENPGGCTSASREAVVVTIASPIVANAGTPQSICKTGSASLGANNPSPGTGSWSVVDGPSIDNAQFGNITSASTSFTPNGGAGIYTLRWTISKPPCTTTSDVDITVTGYTWTGALNSQWDNAANWTSCGVPPPSSDIIIADVTNYPVLNTDFAVGNIELDDNAKLDLNGHVLTLNGSVSGSGTLKGSTASSILINDAVSAGTLSFTEGSEILKDLTLNSGAVAVLGTKLNIAAGSSPGTLSVLSGAVLVSTDSLILKSDLNGTARAGVTDGTMVGDVTVERYIPSDEKRAWRLLSIPTQTSQSIHDAWQEGQATGSTSLHNYGTNITSSSPTWSDDGFDYQTPGNSMFTYNQENNSWDNIQLTSFPITTTSGYFLYIRGDRTQTPSTNSSVSTPTILRTTGPLYQGDQTSIFTPAGKFGLIGNIYASAIDFDAITKDDAIDNTFYVWDPKVLNLPPSLGGYQTFKKIGDTWTVLPGGGSYPAATSTIESGQAFFVHATTDGTITLTENCKVAGSKNVFRPQAPDNMYGQIKANLYEVNGSVATLADANLTVFNSAYADTIDGNDAYKLSNDQENFAIMHDKKVLVVDARQPIEDKDTIAFDMWNIKQQQYKLEFVPTNLNASGLTAYLLDNYLNTTTPIDLQATTTISFSANTNAASSAANRFSVVFHSSSPVPVTYTNVKAYQQSSSIQVEWSITNQSNVRHYEVERSADGISFSSEGFIAVNSANIGNYSWLDTKPSTGDNYYRIKSTDINGAVKYSTVVKVNISDLKPAFAVYPNPVVDGRLSLQLKNQPMGTYSISLFTATGQLLYQSTINHGGGSSTQPLTIPAASKGVYKLEVATPLNNKFTQKLIIQ